MKKIVLWVDMLGFTNWILQSESDPTVEIEDLVRKCSTYNGVGAEKYMADAEFYVLADTFILTIPYQSKNQLTLVSALANAMSTFCLELGFPTRGAVSIGSVFINTNVNGIIVAGEAIAEASEAEKSLNTMCVILSDSVVKALSSCTYEDTVIHTEHMDIPLSSFISQVIVNTKQGDKEAFVVSWIDDFIPKSILENVMNIVKDKNRHSELPHLIKKMTASSMMLNTLSDESEYENIKHSWEGCLSAYSELL